MAESFESTNSDQILPNLDSVESNQNPLIQDSVESTDSGQIPRNLEST